MIKFFNSHNSDESFNKNEYFPVDSSIKRDADLILDYYLNFEQYMSLFLF